MDYRKTSSLEDSIEELVPLLSIAPLV